METDKTEQLKTLLAQTAKVLNKNQVDKEMDALTTFKRANRSPSPLDSQDIHTAFGNG